MDEDFPTSPSKRRRTESPAEATMEERKTSIPGLTLTEEPMVDGRVNWAMNEADDPQMDVKEEPWETVADPGPDLLNMLMARVEAQARDTEPTVRVEETLEAGGEEHARDEPDNIEQNSAPHVDVAQAPKAEQDKMMAEVESSLAGEDPSRSGDAQVLPAVPQQEPVLGETATTADSSNAQPQPGDLQASLDGPEPTTADPAPPAEKEWETDSSPYSSSTDSSDDSSSDEDSDDEEDNDYALLSPTEQARMLMDEAGSDDEGHRSKTGGGVVKTANEKIEEVIPKPDIVVTPEMRIEELGNVEAVVESTVLIRGRTTGEYQVLESGSLLCLKDRSVIGVVADLMGQVKQPLYTVRFTNDEAIAGAGVADKGTIIYYVHDHSTFVFTQPLKGLKGSDASNFHDEEVGDEEMEFSDDEQEAEHKRMLKLRRRGIDVDPMGGRGGRGGGRGSRGGGRGRGRGGFTPGLHTHPENSLPGASEAVGLNYDEGEIMEYEPLRRSSTMHNQEAPQQSPFQRPEQQLEQYTPPKFQQNDGRRDNSQRGRGHNNRGRGRGNRGNFHQNRSQPPNHLQPNGYQHQQSQQPHDFNQQQQQSWMPPIPPPPGMPNFFNPSTMPGAPNLSFGQQPNGFSQSFGQQNSYAQNYGQQNGYAQQNQPYANPWASNQAAAEQVQRQLEELRRQAQQHGGGGPNYG